MLALGWLAGLTTGLEKGPGVVDGAQNRPLRAGSGSAFGLLSLLGHFLLCQPTKKLRRTGTRPWRVGTLGKCTDGYVFLKASLLLADFGLAESWGFGGEPRGGGDKNQSQARDKAGERPCPRPSSGAMPQAHTDLPCAEEGFLIQPPGSCLPAVLEAIQGWPRAVRGAVGVV